MKNVIRAIVRKEAKIMPQLVFEQALNKQREARKSAWERDYRQNIAPNIARIRAAGGA